MNVSLGAFSFFNELNDGRMNTFGYLETVKHRYRLDTVDLWNGFYEDRDEFVWKPADDQVLLNIRAALEERKLLVANIAIDRAHVWDPDPDIRASLKHNALRQLQAAKLLGAKTVRIDACYRNTEEMSEEAFAYAVRTFREYADIAAEYGLLVGPENHMGIALDARWLRRLAEAVDHPAFGILLHLGRWKEGGDEEVAQYAYHVHVDAKSLVDQSIEERFRMLRDSGYRGHWAVEYNPTANRYDEIGWALAVLRRLLVQTYN
jgi:sugar phosphate isomerase/epimerase